MDLAGLERILARLDPDDATWLDEELEPAWRRRQRRLNERDRMVREAARYDFPEFATSGRRMSGMIARDPGRYAASTYRFERDGGSPADPACRRLWLILQLNGGKRISASSIRDALAGVNRNRPELLFAQTANQAIHVQNRPRTGDAHGGEEGAEKRRR